MIRRDRPRRTASAALIAFVAAVAVLVPGSAPLRGEVLPPPTITAWADPFNATFGPTNLFDVGTGEYVTSGQLAGTPFTRNDQDGTWVELDYGGPVTIDTFINRTRANPVDQVTGQRLIFSQDGTFDASDSIVTLPSAGANGAGFVRRFTPQTAQYVRWEVTEAGAGSLNLGGRQFFFLNTPAGQTVLPNPTVYNAATPFNGDYVAANAANGNAGRAGTGAEYASQGLGNDTFVDFDFGGATPISGFNLVNREQDVTTSYDMIFSNTPDFSDVVATRSFFTTGQGNDISEEVFDPVTARYVRFDVTSYIGTGGATGNNTGISEMWFLTPVPEPGALSLVAAGALALLRRRRQTLV